MDALRYRDEYNKVGYLLKPTGSDDYHQIIDFLRASHIRYALTHNPIIFDSLVKQFWFTTTLRTPELADDGGIDDLPTVEIYSRMDNLGTKSGSWDQSGSPIVVALICLSNGRRFNWSSYIFKGMVSNIGNAKRTKKRKLVVSDSDQDEGKKQDVDLNALRALANVAMTADSNISPGGAFSNPAASTSVPYDVPTGASSVPTYSLSIPSNVPPSVDLVDVSNKGKAPMVDEYILIKARTFKQMEEDILDKEAAKRLHDEDQAQLDRQQAELQRRRQQEILLGDDVSEDNFPALMAALIQRKRQALAEKLAQESMARVKSFTDAQLKEEFEKIQKAISNTQIQAFSRTMKRRGPVIEEPSSKKQNSTEAPLPSVTKVPQSLVVSSHTSSGTRRKSFARKRLTKPKSTLQDLDLDADAQTFIKVASTEDSDDEAPPVWSVLVGWEVIPTPLGNINALYRIDQSTKHFTTLRQILHMVDRQDLGDLHVLFDSHEGETVSGEVLSMFADVSYPLSVKLMEKMLRHKLEIDKDVVGNDMTTAEQLIQFIKNQLAAAHVSYV
nr:hypothetical protein [Tanacetum cinerariifolium]